MAREWVSLVTGGVLAALLFGESLVGTQPTEGIRWLSVTVAALGFLLASYFAWKHEHLAASDARSSRDLFARSMRRALAREKRASLGGIRETAFKALVDGLDAHDQKVFAMLVLAGETQATPALRKIRNLTDHLVVEENGVCRVADKWLVLAEHWVAAEITIDPPLTE